MKKLSLIILFTVTIKLAFACSCSPWNAFCTSTTKLPNDLILSGKIVYSDTIKIKIEVIEIFKGEENNDTITIWNGKEFDCNGIFPMKANELGNLNDTIVVILPRIINENLENPWDVIGDYRRPMPLCYSPSLHVVGDSIFGLINNSGISYPYWSFKKMLYNNFRNLWSGGQIDCSELVSIEEAFKQSQFECTIINQQIKVSTNSNQDFNIRVFDMLGVQMDYGIFKGSASIPIRNKKHGVYLILISNRTEVYRKKVIIN